MSKIEVNTVAPQCGTTLTLGESGDTVTLGSGASQSGFGRTGTVDWQTTKKTATFTAANGEGYFVDTSGGAVTMNLPSSPSAGNIVAVKDYDGSFNSNNLTIGRGGSNINGAGGSDVTISTAGASIVLVYVDGTQGWVATQDDSSTFTGATFITATGGTITTCGDDKIHTFTGPGTFTVCSASCSATNNIVSYLVVAGGGGTGCGGCGGRGGGGAGGYREIKNPINSFTASPLDGYSTPGNRVTVSATAYPITVGGGGTAGNPTPAVTKGSNSVFSTITSAGGGAGYQGQNTTLTNGGSGGGGSALPFPSPNNLAGTGNSPPVTPPQGNNGGNGLTNSSGPSASYRAGGGGGAGAVGTAGSFPGDAGAGGAGATTGISGCSTTYAGGGGGGAGYEPGGTQAPVKAPGGAGGGGTGSRGNGDNGTAGTANTGGGGGGGGYPTNPCTGRAGGSGIVIIRYKFQ